MSDRFKTRAFHRILPVQLTEDEINARAREMAKEMKEVEQLEFKKKDHASQMKQQIDKKLAVVHELAKEIRDEEINKPTKCEKEYDCDTWTVTTVRLDTGEVLDQRAMDEAEQKRFQQIDHSMVSGEIDPGETDYAPPPEDDDGEVEDGPAPAPENSLHPGVHAS